MKFRGAGQGPRVLVAEWLAGEIARALGLLVPDLVAVDLDARDRRQPSRTRRSTTCSWRASARNIGLDFLPGSMTFNPAVDRVAGRRLGGAVVWLDALVTNPDRSPKNPNLLVWHGRTWLIDHGAALYIHHTWRDPDAHARRPFASGSPTTSCCRSPRPSPRADERLAPLVTASLLEDLVAADPRRLARARCRASATRTPSGGPTSRTCSRRLEAPRPFVEAAERARGGA